MVRELSKILKIFLIGCKITKYLAFLQIFFVKSCILLAFCYKKTIFVSYFLAFISKRLLFKGNCCLFNQSLYEIHIYQFCLRMPFLS